MGIFANVDTRLDHVRVFSKQGREFCMTKLLSTRNLTLVVVVSIWAARMVSKV